MQHKVAWPGGGLQRRRMLVGAQQVPGRSWALQELDHNWPLHSMQAAA